MAYNALTPSVLAEPAGAVGAGSAVALSNIATAAAGPGYGNGWDIANNNGKTWVMLVNKNAAAASVVFISTKTVKGLAVDDVVPGSANLPGSGTNGGIQVFGPFDPDLFGTTVRVAWASGGGAGGIDAYSYQLP